MFGRLARLLLASLIGELGGAAIAAARRRLERELDGASSGPADADAQALKKAPEAPLQDR